MSTVDVSNELHGAQPERRTRAAWFWDRPVGVKIAAAMGVLAVIFSLVGGAGALALLKAGSDMKEINVLSGELQKGFGDLRTAQDRSHLQIRRAAITASEGERQQVLTSTEWNDREVDRLIGVLDGYEQSQTQQWEDFKTRWADWTSFRDSQVRPLVEAGDAEAAAALLASDAAGDPDRAGRALELAQGSVEYRVGQVMSAATSRISLTIVALLVGFIVGAAVAISLAVVVTRRIVRDIQEVDASVGALAQGDLTRAVDVSSNDELGRMARSYDVAQRHLREVVKSVIEESDGVTDAVSQLTAASTQVAAGAEETSAQAGVVAAAAEQVSRNVQATAAGSEEMGSSIREISQNTSQAAQFASTAVAMSNEASRTVGELGESSQEIGSVVKLITSIAEQTNLLALNATIEAARAGDAGKGFAVVASEVKDLAGESARAAEDVARRIAQVQTQTQSAVAAISEIVTIIDSISDYQMTIASAVEEQTATTNEMARSVTEAAAGSGEIAANITGVATAAEQSAAAVSEMTATVNDLATISQRLREHAHSFSV
ncbi:methyl-accepting chemotaxis protein [Flavimobilis soli]|uniref:Methyl-accepting chemotaxis protein n=1 Tax=Flavimobilis soli TaxID=442709 RepID=A0A2A9EF62_9MICO|nr:methyl-accepting chemotaxis protein [Flavimobilis soli]PFG37443.1 methyl-accepting chemotaxis protein [Flavimobilis soli]